MMTKIDLSLQAAKESLRIRRLKQAARKVTVTVTDAHEIERSAANAIENKMLVEWLAHEKQPHPAQTGRNEVSFLSDPRMLGKQPHRRLDRICETLSQSDIYLARVKVRLQRNVRQ